MNHHRSTSMKDAIKDANDIKTIWKGISKHTVDIHQFFNKIVKSEYLKDPKTHRKDVSIC